MPPARRKREWPCNGRAHELGAHEPRYVVHDDKHVKKCDKLVIQISGALCMVGHRFGMLQSGFFVLCLPIRDTRDQYGASGVHCSSNLAGEAALGGGSILVTNMS